MRVLTDEACPGYRVAPPVSSVISLLRRTLLVDVSSVGGGGGAAG